MSIRNDKRTSNFGRMGQMLIGTHDGFGGPTNVKPGFYEEDKLRTGSKVLSKDFESNLKNRQNN